MAKVLGRETIHRTAFGLSVHEETILDRRTGEPTQYTVVERSNGAVIIPIVLHDGKRSNSPLHKTLLLRQHRHPTNEEHWELPMGGVDEDEPSDVAAQRELLEETGIQASQLIQIGRFFPAPGAIRQHADVFIAQVTETQLAQALTHPLTDDILEKQVVTLETLNAMLRNGEVTDGFTLATLSFLTLWLNTRTAAE